MHASWRVGFAALVITLAPACVATPGDDITQEAIVEEDTASASAAITECLAVDTTKHYEGTALGARGDDPFPINGKTITRVEFNREAKCNDRFCIIGGHGDAHISKQDSESVVIHWWYDAFTELNYTLKVWVQC